MIEPLLTPKRWMDDAACRAHNDPDIWHAEGYGCHHETMEARRICRQECPVIAICFAEHSHERYGVWGGLTESERETHRRKLNKRRRRAS